MQEDFFITLPSNVASQNLFPENTIANYKTRLAHRIHLEGKWEVGLSEISFTNSWFNVSQPQTITLFDRDRTYTHDYKIPAARYDDIDHLVDTLNEVMEIFVDKKVKRAPKFGIEKEARRTYLLTGLSTPRGSEEFPLFVKLGSEVAWMLGFRPGGNANKISNIHENVYIHRISKIEPSVYHKDFTSSPYLRCRSTTVYDLNAGYHSIYAYTDIIQPNLVGDINTQLLRVVAIPPGSKYGDQIVQTYQTPHYHPLITQDFDTVEIDLKDETGSKLPFQFGRSILTLHFRRLN